MKKIVFIFLVLIQIIQADSSKKDESYFDLSRDGAWCWFQDPRTLYLKKQNNLVAGFVDSKGSIKISSLDLNSMETQEIMICENLQVDDHAVPSFLQLPDDRLMIFYCAHNGGKMYYRYCSDLSDLTTWSEEMVFPSNISGKKGFCYPNPVYLSAENKIFLFWRGASFKPTFSVSENLGKTWSEPKVLIQSDESDYKRPYLKVFSKNGKRIHLAFTDGHPRDCPLNNIYYLYYENGYFYRADGKRVSSIEKLPIHHENCDLVYNASESNARAWIWDCAVDSIGNPVLVYTWMKEETNHFYYYSRWNGKQWENHQIIRGGQAFPRIQLKKEERDPEPHYSGGVYLNYDNPNIVYVSVPVDDRYEIFQMNTIDGGQNWFQEKITEESFMDNTRPVYAGKYKSEDLILWMNGTYKHYTDYLTSIKLNRNYIPFRDDLSKESVMAIMKRVADWQISRPGFHDNKDWTKGALFKGMTEFSFVCPDSSYLEYILNICQENQWQLGSRKYHADDHCIGQTYLALYNVYKEKKMIEPLMERFRWILNNQPQTDLNMNSPNSQYRWNWCDAIFMSPTVWAQIFQVTGDDDYYQYLKKELNATTEYLYDEDEHLYFRDSKYFHSKERNGKKVFWGRGNGWVLAGLTEIIENTKRKKDFNKKYSKIFVQMAERISKLQNSDGYWRASLLDPGSYPAPETSCSGFFCYSLAWGINNGLLEKEKYYPVVEKAWKALVKAVHSDGKLGFVQQIGEDPKKTNIDQTEVYGVGAFLLAGSEIVKMVQ